MAPLLQRTALVLVLIWPPVLFAAGFSNMDIGLKRCGMFSVTANPDDVTAIYHNPAGLVNLKGLNVNVFGSLFFVELGLKMYDSKGKLYPVDHEIEPTQFFGVSPFIGASTDLGSERWRLAVALYFPNAYGGFLPEDEPTRYHLIDGYFVAGFAGISGALKVSDELYVGAGLSVIHMVRYGRRIFNLLVENDPDLRFNPTASQELFDFEVELEGSGTTVGYNFGVIFKPHETVSIGVSFTSDASADISGTVRLKTSEDSTSESEFTNPTVIPITLRGGISWAFSRKWEVAFDIYFWNYQIFETNVIELEKTLFGIKKLDEPKNYHNAWAYCFGLLYRLTESLELMIGYERDYSPIPDETVSVDNPTRSLHGLALGARWKINDNFRVGLAYVRNWYDKLDTKDSILSPPFDAKGQGYNNEIAFELNLAL